MNSPAKNSLMCPACVLSVMLLIPLVLCSLLTCSPGTYTASPVLLAQRVSLPYPTLFQDFEINVLLIKNCFLNLNIGNCDIDC